VRLRASAARCDLSPESAGSAADLELSEVSSVETAASSDGSARELWCAFADEPFDLRTVDGGAFDGGAFDGGAFDGGAFDGGAFDGGEVLVFASALASSLPRRLALAPARVGGALERCFRSLIEEFLASRGTLLASARPENASLLTPPPSALDKS